MNFLGNVFDWLFGNKQKKQDQAPPAHSVSTRPVAQPSTGPVSSNTAGTNPLATPLFQLPNSEAQKPSNTLNLVSLTDKLQKATPTPTPPPNPQPAPPKPVQPPVAAHPSFINQIGQAAGELASTSNDRFLVSPIRNLIKFGGHLTGHDQQVNGFLDKALPEVHYDSTAGRIGDVLGNTQSLVTDIATLPVGSGEAGLAVKGSKLLNALSDTGRGGELLAKVAPRIASSAAGSGIVAAQDVEHGRPQNIAADIALGTAADIGLPIAGRLVGKGMNLVRGGVSKDVPVLADSLSQAVADTPGLRSLNQQPLLKVPQTVGEATDQARIAGGVKLPDAAFNADARTVATQTPENLLDIPTFLRQNSPQLQQQAQDTIGSLDQRIGLIKAGAGPVQDFRDAQRIAAAYQQSPQAGKAMSQIIDSQRAAFNPQQALIKASQERSQAVADLHQARQAQVAQEALQAQQAAPDMVAPTLSEAAPSSLPIGPEVSPSAISPTETANPLVSPERPPEVPIAPALETPPVQPVTNTVTPPVEATNGIVPNELTASQMHPQLNGVSANEVPTAPDFHDAMAKQLGGSFANLKGDYHMRNSLNIQDAAAEAKRAFAAIPDDQLLAQYRNVNPSTFIRDGRDMAIAQAALERLYRIDNPETESVVYNLMDAMEQGGSRAGQISRVVQQAFDTMPLPMKVRYLLKKVDAFNVKTPNYSSLKERPADASVIDATLTNYLQKSQDLADQVSALEGKMQAVMEGNLRGEVTDPKLVAQMQKQVAADRLALQVQNGEAVKYFNTLIPGRTKAQKALADFPRQMMLGSFTGRANDIVTTASNVAHLVPQNLVQGVLAKAVNRFKPGLVTDTSKGMGALLPGVLKGAKRTVGEMRGRQYVDDLGRATRNNTELRSGLTKATNVPARIIQSATEAATHMSGGVTDMRLLQLADQEAAKLGVPVEARQQYAQMRAMVPTRQMQTAADMLHKQVNNLNENPLSRKLASISAGIGGNSAVGGLLKNQILPFTSWVGGNIWNSVTDKNVIANGVKLGVALKKGDAEGIVRNLAAAGVGTAQGYALGYRLSQMGLLSPTNAEGYPDGGLYFHVGDRYIPVGILGFFAPNIVLGNAAYDALNNNQGKNPLEVMGEDIGRFAWNGLAVGTALGVENNFQRAYDAATRPGGNALDGLFTGAAGALGQFIPSLTGDINAVLDNYTSLNPTHEKADTRVESNAILKNGQKSTAKDVPASAVEQLKNRIPVLSQTLPRKMGVAAPDVIDRTVKGDRDTQTSIAARQNAQAILDQQKDFTARGIPYYGDTGFSDAIQARVERGEYGKAIEGLEAKLSHDKQSNNIPQSKLKKQQTEITRLGVLQDKKIGPNTYGLYMGSGSDGVSLSEWHNMGDSNSDTYNPQIYQLLWDLDNAMADAGVSRNTTDPHKTFYSAKTVKAKSASGGRRSGDTSAIRGNTIGAVPDLGKISFGALVGKQVTVPKIPTIAKVSPNDLPKKRKISVSK